MDIPKLNVTVTKAATNGQVVDVVTFDEFTKNKSIYEGRTDVAIPVQSRGRELLLPLKGEYPTNGSTPISPGIYTGGPVDFIVEPESGFADRYVSKNKIVMNNNNDIRDLIRAEEESKKLDEPFITSPDCITNIPVREGDQPEMVCLKMALNSKRIDIDKYASRFGSNYPNDKRQLKSESATLNIIKRFCKHMDMEAILTLKDANPDVPNPMNTEITVSLTDPDSVLNLFNATKGTINNNEDESDEDSDF